MQVVRFDVVQIGAIPAAFSLPLWQRPKAFCHARGGRKECHEFSSPVCTRSSDATGELSSMAFQVGVSAPHMPPVTPT